MLDKKKEGFIMPLVDTIIKKPKYEFRIEYDECPSKEDSPREMENQGIMALEHKEYELPWESDLFTRKDGEKNNKILQSLRENKKFAILPVRMYVNESIEFRANIEDRFNYPWNSSFIGCIYAKIEKDQTKEDVISILQIELKALSMFLNGELFAFDFIDNMNDKNNSCISGYYAENLEEDARDFLKGEVNIKLTRDETDYLIEKALKELRNETN